MCGGVAYLNGSEVVRAYFPNPEARLPVLRRDGEIELVRWGRRESDKECLTLPRGGWARLDSLRAGKWDRWFPKPIRIPALSYMEKDPRGCSINSSRSVSRQGWRVKKGACLKRQRLIKHDRKLKILPPSVRIL